MGRCNKGRTQVLAVFWVNCFTLFWAVVLTASLAPGRATPAGVALARTGAGLVVASLGLAGLLVGAGVELRSQLGLLVASEGHLSTLGP